VTSTSTAVRPPALVCVSILVNSRGHAKTLVPKHPGNKNALKAGVFSPETLAPRIQEVHAEIATRSVDEVLRDVLQREVASLAVLGEAMDRTLGDDGLIGRRGEPRRMIDLRLRLNEKLRRTLDRYEQVNLVTGASPEPGSEDDPPPRSLVQEMVLAHARALDEPVGPEDFDPEVFLHAVIVTSDPMTKTADRVRARKLLTRRRTSRPETCSCIGTIRARTAVDFYGWVEDLRRSGVEAARGDPRLAAIVRSVARGEAVDRHASYAMYRRSTDAVRALVDTTAAMPAERHTRRERSDSSAVKPFWSTVLSSDPRVKTKDRLDAFVLLDEVEALPRCTCRADPETRLAEIQDDAFRAYVIRMVSQTHYRSAMIAARYPETYVAVRQVLDDAVLASAEDADTDS
jgi:hypothetical protein